jgi:hypothetical protein
VSAARAVSTYIRSGGQPPEDDERLDVLEDGTWRLWRTMGGPRVGGFSGHLSAARHRRLDDAIAAVWGVGVGPVAPVAHPDVAREAFTAGEDRLDVTAGARVTGPWAALARLLRRWTEDLTTEPAGALALEVPPGGGLPRLVHLGAAALRLWPATLHVELYARDADGVIRDRASGGAVPEDLPQRGDPLATADGWAMDLPVGRHPEVPPGGVLEVWALLDIEGPDGPVQARLTWRETAGR